MEDPRAEIVKEQPKDLDDDKKDSHVAQQTKKWSDSWNAYPTLMQIKKLSTGSSGVNVQMV